MLGCFSSFILTDKGSILPYPILPFSVLYYTILSYRILSYLILSYPILSCPPFLCPTLSYHFLPSLVIFHPFPLQLHSFIISSPPFPSLLPPPSFPFYPSPSTLLHTYCYLTLTLTYEHRVRAGLLGRIDIGRTGKEHARCKTPLHSAHW